MAWGLRIQPCITVLGSVWKPHSEGVRNPKGEAASSTLGQWQGRLLADNLWLWVSNWEVRNRRKIMVSYRMFSGMVWQTISTNYGEYFVTCYYCCVGIRAIMIDLKVRKQSQTILKQTGKHWSQCIFILPQRSLNSLGSRDVCLFWMISEKIGTSWSKIYNYKQREGRRRKQQCWQVYLLMETTVVTVTWECGWYLCVFVLMNHSKGRCFL
jgi:hypothetical protein